jgi:hypothetical protein
LEIFKVFSTALAYCGTDFNKPSAEPKFFPLAKMGIINGEYKHIGEELVQQDSAEETICKDPQSIEHQSHSHILY